MWCSIFEPLSWCGAEHAVENNTGRYVAFSPEWTEPYPWTFFRGPELWEQRLRQHWAPRGVTVTPHYLKVHSFVSSVLIQAMYLRRGTRCTAGLLAHRIPHVARTPIYCGLKPHAQDQNPACVPSSHHLVNRRGLSCSAYLQRGRVIDVLLRCIMLPQYMDARANGAMPCNAGVVAGAGGSVHSAAERADHGGGDGDAHEHVADARVAGRAAAAEHVGAVPFDPGHHQHACQVSPGCEPLMECKTRF